MNRIETNRSSIDYISISTLAALLTEKECRVLALFCDDDEPERFSHDLFFASSVVVARVDCECG